MHKSLFPNWTPAQVRRSGIRDAIVKDQEYPCNIYVVDVMETGGFETREVRTILKTEKSKAEFWGKIHEPVSGTSMELLYRPFLLYDPSSVQQAFALDPTVWKTCLALSYKC